MNSLLKRTLLFLSITLFSMAVWAQDKKVDVDINLNKHDDTGWYQRPWIWVVGAAVFVLLLVIILKPRKRAS